MNFYMYGKFSSQAAVVGNSPVRVYVLNKAI